MSCYQCDACGCVENTAVSNYLSRKYPYDADGKILPSLPLLCSQCDPKIGKWHGYFKRMSAKGFFLCDDGFLYSKEEIKSSGFKWRMKHQGLKVVREITEEGVVSITQG